MLLADSSLRPDHGCPSEGPEPEDVKAGWIAFVDLPAALPWPWSFLGVQPGQAAAQGAGGQGRRGLRRRAGRARRRPRRPPHRRPAERLRRGPAGPGSPTPCAPARRRARRRRTTGGRPAPPATTSTQALEVGEHVVRRHQHRRVLRPAGALGEVGGVVRDHRSVPPGASDADAVRTAPRALVGRQLEVGDDGQVVATRLPRRRVGARPSDRRRRRPARGPCRARPARSRPRSRPSRAGPARSRCGPRPRRGRRAARRQVRALGRHELVRLGRPDQLARRRTARPRRRRPWLDSTSRAHGW